MSHLTFFQISRHFVFVLICHSLAYSTADFFYPKFAPLFKQNSLCETFLMIFTHYELSVFNMFNSQFRGQIQDKGTDFKGS